MLRHPYPAPLALSLCAGLALGQGALEGTLRQAAEKAGLDIGFAATSFQLTGGYGETAGTHFNLIVSEKELHFLAAHPARDRFSFSGGDKLYAWGEANGVRLRGHAFVWPAQSGWVAGTPATREGRLAVLKTHIDSVGGHFKGKAAEWIVVNEILSDAGTGGGNPLRASDWRLYIGEDFADSAFVYARRADPYAKLYYNDYGGENANSKSDAMLNLAARWIRNGIPIDGIGLECHLAGPVDMQSISANIKRFGELGLRVSLSEVDIKNGTAEDWANVMAACLENFNCTSFVTWGLHDGTSWLGSNCGCLLFADSTRPKAAVQALIDLMNNADPEVAAKRKDFVQEPSVPLLPPPRAVRALRPRDGGFFLSADGALSFPDGSAAVDALGRHRIMAPGIPGASGLLIPLR